MECRPFKDPTYDLRRMEQEVAVQAVPVTQDLAIQATPARVGTQPHPSRQHACSCGADVHNTVLKQLVCTSKCAEHSLRHM